MRVFAILLTFVCGVFCLNPAQATVRVAIDLSTQTMHVTSSSGSYTWAISSARSGYGTPRGLYHPTSLQRMHYSHKYHMSPMPYSIFFRGGYAIHGTYSTAQLGHPASHGCVRLSPANAAHLFGMVKAEGAAISISGTPPHTMYAKAHRTHGHGHLYAQAHHHHPTRALAYAPMRPQVPTVRMWQFDPAGGHW